MELKTRYVITAAAVPIILLMGPQLAQAYWGDGNGWNGNGPFGGWNGLGGWQFGGLGVVTMLANKTLRTTMTTAMHTTRYDNAYHVIQTNTGLTSMKDMIINGIPINRRKVTRARQSISTAIITTLAQANIATNNKIHYSN